jgi:hypothetical protein
MQNILGWRLQRNKNIKKKENKINKKKESKIRI